MEPSTAPDAPDAPTTHLEELGDELGPDADGLGLTRAQLFAVYGLLIGGAVLLALYRVQRKRAGELGAGVAPLAGAPRVRIDDVALEPRLRALLEHYAAATQESLGAAASSLERLEARVGALEGRVSIVTAGRPAPRGAAPAPPPTAAAVSVNDATEREGLDAGELVAVPLEPLADEVLAEPAIPPAAAGLDGDARVSPMPVPRFADNGDDELGGGMAPAAVGNAPGTE